MIPGIPEADSQRLLELIRTHPEVLYGSRAIGRQRAGQDLDLYLEAPSMELGELLELGAAFDDLLLPCPIYLQLRHLIAHEELLAHIERAGQLLWERSPNAKPPQQTL